MSNADPTEVVTASSDGVTVEKSFEPDDFPVPAIAFAIESERDESVSVRITDTVPEDVAPEDIGFHPDYGAEFWDVEEGQIVFERDFDAGEEFTTVYGLRGGDAEVARKFMSEPEIESVDPPLSGPERAAAQAAGDIEMGIGPIADDATASGAGRTTAGADDRQPSAGQADDGEQAAIAPGDEDSLVAQLATEINAGAVDRQTVLYLRDALGVNLASASVEARIEQLQSSVADLDAYTSALEAFLDENGDAQQLIQDVRDDYEETTARIDAVESVADEAVEATDDIDARLDDVEETFEEQLDDVETRLDDVVTEVEDDLEAIDEEVEVAVESELEALESRVDSIADDAAAATDGIEELREELSEVETGLQEETETRLDELEAEIESLEAELSDVAELRDRLATALSGLGGNVPAVGDGEPDTEAGEAENDTSPAVAADAADDVAGSGSGDGTDDAAQASDTDDGAAAGDDTEADTTDAA
ncbi:probable coiled coil protein [Natronomonas pharaonis DSM 2160]|uniref:Probable coiled coil protein n=1 Tax=Natronomonas pharaonis (strain ATCC 35678 / DSM 2160 / CIP 103997 / JCM 8858 / NBRC 14720 / NCIMB 2260 / Gabara) TaxID=348780 RepID=A0A1U7EX39_NATPD|nr:transducer protein [Natronomonas pharaonis]CAI49666.1 probable coiled coil protein [Natronomonas pharaonis DSM 2160]